MCCPAVRFCRVFVEQTVQPVRNGQDVSRFPIYLLLNGLVDKKCCIKCLIITIITITIINYYSKKKLRYEEKYAYGEVFNFTAFLLSILPFIYFCEEYCFLYWLITFSAKK